MSTKLETSDPRIWKFYQENKNLDFTAMNLIFIDILSKLSKNLSSTITQTVNSRILDVVTEINSSLNTMKLDFVLKLQEAKSAYVEDLKSALQNSSLNNNEKLHNLLDKSNDVLIAKTTSLLNDVIPKTQDRGFAFIEASIRSQCSLISEDTKKILNQSSGSSEDRLRDVLALVEKHLSSMSTNINETLLNVLDRNESKICEKISCVTSTIEKSSTSQKEVVDDIKQFVDRYKNNSQAKGSVAETELYFILQSLFPSSEITRVTGEKAFCDFVMKRPGDLSDILFESKDYRDSVPRHEVEKFERDVLLRKCHGIMISQNSPIVFRKQYDVQVINGCILVYVSNVDFNPDKVRVAVDIVDHLHSVMSKFERSVDSIELTDVNEFLEEFKSFNERKEKLMSLLTVNNKMVFDQINELQLPKLRNFLSCRGKVDREVKYVCEKCSKVWPSKASLSSHMKFCKERPDVSASVVSGSIDSSGFSLSADGVVIEDVSLSSVSSADSICGAKKNKVKTKVVSKVDV